MDFSRSLGRVLEQLLALLLQLLGSVEDFGGDVPTKPTPRESHSLHHGGRSVASTVEESTEAFDELVTDAPADALDVFVRTNVISGIARAFVDDEDGLVEAFGPEPLAGGHVALSTSEVACIDDGGGHVE